MVSSQRISESQSQQPPDGSDLSLVGRSSDPINLNCVYVRLLLAKTDEYPHVDAVLREYDSDTLMEIERHLWIYGRDYWADVIQKCHRLITRSRQSTRPEASIFQNVKAKVRIEVLAARFTALRRAGSKRLKGRCPLHDEKTPSFVVDLEKQRWRCYGACGVGGDVIELGRRLMQKGKL